jgi:hypothetical protein
VTITSLGFHFSSKRSSSSQSLLLLPTHSRCRGSFAFHLITLRHTPQSVGLLWTRDRPAAETSTLQHTHKRQTSMPPVGFEPAIPTSARPQSYVLDRANTGVPMILLCITAQRVTLNNDCDEHATDEGLISAKLQDIISD